MANTDLKEHTAHLIDNEPVLMLGCSNTEIFTLAGLGFGTGLILGLIFGVLFSQYVLIVPFPMLMTVISVYFGGKRLGRAKEGKPDGFFNRFLLNTFCRLGWRSGFVQHKGFWSIRR